MRVTPSCHDSTRFLASAEKELIDVLRNRRESALSPLHQQLRHPAINHTHPTNPTAFDITARSNMDGYQLPCLSTVPNLSWSK